MDISSIIKPWRLSQQTPYIFYNANIIDPVEGAVLPNATITLADGKIRSITQTNPDQQALDGILPDNVVDLQGKYVCPGLIDCHVHVAVVPGEADLAAYRDMTIERSLIRQPHVLRAMLSRGFTTVRDCGGAGYPMKEAIEEGVLPGPRLFVAGRALSQTGGHGDMRSQHDTQLCCGGHTSGISRIVDGVPECLRFAREELRQGADFLKIMGGGGVSSPTDRIDQVQFSDEEIRAMVTVATNAGTYVTSHSYTPAAIQQAIAAGVRGIEHGNLLDEETARLMARTGTFLTPTLVAHATSKKMGFHSAESDKKNTEVLDKGIHALKLATDSGVTVCFGSDLLGPMHFAQSQEFAIRRQVQTPLQLLQSATVNAAKLLMQEGSLGQVKEGFLADLLVLEGNPLEDISILERPESSILAVVKDGRVASSRLPGIVAHL